MTWTELRQICEAVERGEKWQYEIEYHFKKEWIEPITKGVDHFLTMAGSGHLVRIAPKPKIIPWTSKNQVPWKYGFYKHKEQSSPLYKFDSQDFEKPYAWEWWLENIEWTDDLKTWHPCGTVVEES